MSAPTKRDLAEFRAFCRGATLDQLREIERKEQAARRLHYVDIARAELRLRERVSS